MELTREEYGVFFWKILEMKGFEIIFLIHAIYILFFNFKIN